MHHQAIINGTVGYLDQWKLNPAAYKTEPVPKIETLPFLKTSKSPLAPQFAESVMDFNIVGVEESLAKLGFAVKDLDCYKHWAAKRLTA